MMVNEKRDNANSVSHISENTESEAQDSDYPDDTYPYTIRGILWALLFAIIFWVIFIGGILLLVF